MKRLARDANTPSGIWLENSDIHERSPLREIDAGSLKGGFDYPKVALDGSAQERRMEFWIIASIIALLVAGLLALTAMRRRVNSEGGNDIQVYRDQLEEVTRDRARGVTSEVEAERLRLEVSRRLLEADKAAASGVGFIVSGSSPVLATLMTTFVLGGAVYTYMQLGTPSQRDLPIEARLEVSEDLRLNRQSQADAEAQVVPRGNVQSPNPGHEELMEKLRAALLERPDDLQGHVLLAQNEAGLGDFAAARKAQEQVLRIKGDQATAAEYADYVDMLALAADGYISPEAETAAKRVLVMDPINGTARYYLGLMNAQIGRPDLAFEAWERLLNESRPEAPWVPPIRAQIEFVAADAGIRYQLPEQDTGTAGPSAEDIEAAGELSTEDRAGFIQSMVAQLSERLANEGGNAEEWAQLINALGVLGETERARAIWGESQKVFGTDPIAIQTLLAAAQSAGVAE